MSGKYSSPINSRNSNLLLPTTSSDFGTDRLLAYLQSKGSGNYPLSIH